MSLLDIAKKRFSVRKYADRSVEKEKLDKNTIIEKVKGYFMGKMILDDLRKRLERLDELRQEAEWQ